MIRYIRCTGCNGQNGITEDRLYELIYEGEGSIGIVNDYNIRKAYPRSIFEDQCAIPPNEFKKVGFMDFLKNYFTKHQDSLMTLAVIILLDHFLFDGAFRNKIKGMVDNLINKTEKNLLEEGK